MTGSINISQRDKGDKKVVLSTRLPCPQPCPACMVAFFKSYVFVRTHAILWLAISAKSFKKLSLECGECCNITAILTILETLSKDEPILAK